VSPVSESPILVTRGLTKVYPNSDHDLEALRDVDLEVPAGQFLAVVGPSGCGKTTLLRLLGGLLVPTAGSVVFEGEPLRGPRRRIGVVFQQSNLMPWRTARDNIRLPLELQGIDRATQADRAARMVDLVGLGGFESTLPGDLSGGMAQRVALARALVHEPDLLLLDEPFGALDAITRERMAFELLRIWAARPVTVIMVTHSIPEALLLADRVVVLSARPGTVRLDLEVGLPRPRAPEVVHTLPFGALASRIRSLL
jgi:NitT/TauT family transport system ATP-binding protein